MKLFFSISDDLTSSVNIDKNPTFVFLILPDNLEPPIIGTISPSLPIPILLLKKRSTSPGLPTENCPAFSKKKGLFSGKNKLNLSKFTCCSSTST